MAENKEEQNNNNNNKNNKHYIVVLHTHISGGKQWSQFRHSLTPSTLIIMRGRKRIKNRKRKENKKEEGEEKTCGVQGLNSQPGLLHPATISDFV
jgi:hypothetical protein